MINPDQDPLNHEETKKLKNFNYFFVIFGGFLLFMLLIALYSSDFSYSHTYDWQSSDSRLSHLYVFPKVTFIISLYFITFILGLFKYNPTCHKCYIIVQMILLVFTMIEEIKACLLFLEPENYFYAGEVSAMLYYAIEFARDNGIQYARVVYLLGFLIIQATVGFQVYILRESFMSKLTIS